MLKSELFQEDHFDRNVASPNTSIGHVLGIRFYCDEKPKYSFSRGNVPALIRIVDKHMYMGYLRPTFKVFCLI